MKGKYFTLLILTAIMLIGAINTQAGTNGGTTINPDAPGQFLLVQDLPVFDILYQDLLSANGIIYDQITSDLLGSVDLRIYGKVIISGAQDSRFVETIVSFLPELENFVDQGGYLEFHVNTVDLTDYPILPFGIGFTSFLDDTVTILDPGHPSLYTVRDMTTYTLGCWQTPSCLTSTGYFDAPGEILGNSAARVTTLEMPLGAGFLFLTSNLMDDAYAEGINPMLENVLVHYPLLDTDGDGLTDNEELLLGTDPINPDTDLDGLSDGAEVNIYGTDPNNPDPDLDGLSDYDEVVTYGTDPWSSDTDGDGYKDGEEVVSGTNPLDAASYPGADPDTDGDGLTDSEEIIYGTNPDLWDTDGDGYGDGAEVEAGTDPLDAASYPIIVPVDSDGDGISDDDEAILGTNPNIPDTDGDDLSDGDEYYDLGTDPLDPDSDDDGLNDGAEVITYGTDPLNSDTDGDGFTDGEEVEAGTDPLDVTSYPIVVPVDSDGDGLSDDDEAILGTDPNNNDTDADGLSDGDEYYDLGTDPLDPDSDDDGLNDGAEVLTYSTNPLNSDTDGDGFSDGEEVEAGTDPLDVTSYPIVVPIDSDGDGISDDDETNLYGTDPNNNDTDADDLSDGDEILVYDTDPLDNDSDDDTYLDGIEIAEGTDPNNEYSFPGSGNDKDGDGLTNGEERRYGTDPENPDTDGDGYTDGEEVANGWDPLDPNSPGDIEDPSSSASLPSLPIPFSNIYIIISAFFAIALVSKKRY